MKFWQTKTFQSLQRAWYAALAADGFVDAEELVGGEMMLRQMSDHVLIRRGSTQRWADEIGATQEYYRLLSIHAAETEFDSEVDRVIMTMAASGCRQRAIEEALNALGVRRPPRFRSDERRCRESIRLTVRKYERRWGLRA